jgi:peptidoglycan/xylan/chitin deacetylase (PgdA/CDA1 family)
MKTCQGNGKPDCSFETATLDEMEQRMRAPTVLAMTISISFMAAAAWAQNNATLSERLGAIAQRPTAGTCPGNPEALGVARVVEIDTTGGPGFGFEHFKAYDFLRDGEVVLTFDDGPWPGNTPAVLRALAEQCTKAVFFPIGKHAMWHPEILKQVAAEGHTIGSHTWSHADLSKLTPDQAKEEIEKGVSAVRVALGQPEASFFRFPALRHSPELLAYLSARNIGIFSTDMDSFDFKMRKSEQIIESGVEAKEARQRHRPDARLPAPDLTGATRAARPTENQRLQSRAGES